MVKTWIKNWLGFGSRSLSANWLWDIMGAQQSSAGVQVTPEGSLQISAVYSCVRLLSETLAQLPIQCYRRRPNGTKEWLPDYPLQITLTREPNEWQTGFEFFEMMMGHLCLRGNCYARIVPGARGAVTQLIPLRPDRMKYERLVNGRLRFQYTTLDGNAEYYLQDELLRVSGLSIDGVTGLNPVTLQRDPIGTAKATETYGAAFFKNLARPGGLLRTDGVMTADAAKENREQWESVHRGADNQFRTAVLTNGLQWQEVGMHNNDAQFLESRKFNVTEICRIFRVPPHLVYDLDRATFSNIEEQNLEFAIYTMLQWVRRWEAAISRDLIVEPDIYVKFNMEGLLRGNSQARAALYQQALTSGWMSINEVRELEDMDPIENGDVHFMQGAMVPIDRLLEAPQPQQPTVEPVDVEDDEDDAQQIAAVMIAALERNQSLYTEAIQKAHETTQMTVSAVQESVLAGLKATQELAASQLAEAQKQVDLLRNDQLASVAELAKATANLESLSAAYEKAARDADESSELASRLSGTVMAAVGHTSRIIEDRVTRMVRIESNKVSDAAKNPKTFLDVTERFYEDHANKFRECLDVPMALAETLTGNRVEYRDAIDSFLSESRRQLGSIYDTATADVFHDAVSKTVNSWPERAASQLAILWTFNVEGGNEHAQGDE